MAALRLTGTFRRRGRLIKPADRRWAFYAARGDGSRSAKGLDAAAGGRGGLSLALVVQAALRAIAGRADGGRLRGQPD
jgi:hypothetical protein